MSLTQFLNEYKYTNTIKSSGVDIQFKPITTGQMKNLLTYEGNDDPFVIEDILDDIITTCVISPGFDIGEITLQDRFDLLLDIRKRTKGSLYKFTLRCPECKNDSLSSVNIDDLEVIPYPEEIDYVINIDDNFSVELDFIRRSYQRDAINVVKKKKIEKKQQEAVEIATYMYAYAMKKFNTPQGVIEDSPIEDKIELLNNVGENVYENITDWYKKYNYGVVFKSKVECQHCKYSKEIDIPINNFLG